MKLKTILFTALSGILCFTSCQKNLTTFSLDTQSITLTSAGQTKEVNITAIMPSDAKANFTWTSDHPEFATVAKTGDRTATITAVANGTAKITVASSGISKEINVTVNIGGEEPHGEGDGSQVHPYTVAQAINFTGATPQQDNKWVGGYIVGGVIEDGNVISNLQTNPEGYVFSNVNVRHGVILIADNPNETNSANVLVVKLSKETDQTDFPTTLHDALSLTVNCQNYKTYIKVQGDIYRYFAVPGIRRLIGFEGGNQGNNCGEPPVGEGWNLPAITPAELQAMYSGADVTLDGTKKMVGIVTSDVDGNNSTSKKNLIVTSTDNTSGMMFRLTTDNSSLKLGDKVEIKLQGTLTMYSGQYQVSIANANAVKVGTGAITPRVATIAEIAANMPSYNYCVIKTTGTLSGPNTTYGLSSGHVTNTLTDGADHLDFFVARYASFLDQTMPTTPVTVTGIAQSYGTAPVTNQICIRNINDVVVNGAGKKNQQPSAVINFKCVNNCEDGSPCGMEFNIPSGSIFCSCSSCALEIDKPKDKNFVSRMDMKMIASSIVTYIQSVHKSADYRIVFYRQTIYDLSELIEIKYVVNGNFSEVYSLVVLSDFESTDKNATPQRTVLVDCKGACDTNTELCTEVYNLNTGTVSCACQSDNCKMTVTEIQEKIR